MATTTIDLDTELSAVNSILGAIGQSPVTTLNFENPEVSFIYNILTEVNKDIQNEGWHFNIEEKIEVSPDANKEILLPINALRYDIFEGTHDKTKNVQVRSVEGTKKLYDLVNHTFEFTEGSTYYIDVVSLYPFGDIPNIFQRYITYKAAARAATQLIGNPHLVQTLQQDEAKSRATCIDYECEQGDHSFFGNPRGSKYSAFKPIYSLRR